MGLTKYVGISFGVVRFALALLFLEPLLLEASLGDGKEKSAVEAILFTMLTDRGILAPRETEKINKRAR